MWQNRRQYLKTFVLSKVLNFVLLVPPLYFRGKFCGEGLIFLGVIFIGGNYPRGQFSEGEVELSGGQFSWGAIVLEHFQIQTPVFFLQALILKELLHTLKLSLVLRKLFFAIFMFLNFNSSFFQNIFHCNIPLGRGFPTIPYLLNSHDCSKNSYGSKNWCNQLKNRNLNRKLVKEIYDFHGSQPAITCLNF